MYSLKIYQVECGWSWMWIKDGEPFEVGLCHSSSILEVYQDAVIWAANYGPSDLCHSVIQYNGS